MSGVLKIEIELVSKNRSLTHNGVRTPVIGAHTDPGLIGIIVSKLNREIADLFI
ncbi:MAG: hypothetical protein HQ569_02370 [Actinobacteria bacterium]|nr:hypothetical protein [Actinomycetota bacterium]